MKKMTLIGGMLATTLLAVGLMTSAFGQRGGAPDGQRPGAGMRMGPPPIEMVAGDSGLFVLQGLTLTRYDAVTLKQEDTVKLDAEGTAVVETMRPPASTLIVTDDAVLVVTGDTFYRLRAKDLSVAVKTALPTAPTPQLAQAGRGGQQQGQPGRQGQQAGRGGQDGPEGMGQRGEGPGGPGMMGQRGQGMGQRAEYTLHDDTLYLMRGPQLLAINIGTGKVTGSVELAPKDIAPAK